jgi:hypothetical protein
MVKVCILGKIAPLEYRKIGMMEKPEAIKQLKNLSFNPVAMIFYQIL